MKLNYLLFCQVRNISDYKLSDYQARMLATLLSVVFYPIRDISCFTSIHFTQHLQKIISVPPSLDKNAPQLSYMAIIVAYPTIR